ncbi:MAG: recombination-associated protein RdgC [Desulfohalobiaceae bacterium]
MGIFSTSSSISRYRIVQEIEQDFWAQVQDLLLQNAFQEIEDSSQESSLGWVSQENMLDSNWHAASPFKGEYLVFALREDRKKVPPALFRKYYQLALQEQQELNQEQGIDRVSRSQQKKLKEQVRSRLLSRSMPVPAVYEVVWNTGNQHIYLGSTSSRVRTLFEEHFSSSFRLNLEPMNGYFLARSLLDEERLQVLDAYNPKVLI